jgi:hypothetical protein
VPGDKYRVPSDEYRVPSSVGAQFVTPAEYRVMGGKGRVLER